MNTNLTLRHRQKGMAGILLALLLSAGLLIVSVSAVSESNLSMYLAPNGDRIAQADQLLQSTMQFIYPRLSDDAHKHAFFNTWRNGRSTADCSEDFSVPQNMESAEQEIPSTPTLSDPNQEIVIKVAFSPFACDMTHRNMNQDNFRMLMEITANVNCKGQHNIDQCVSRTIKIGLRQVPSDLTGTDFNPGPLPPLPPPPPPPPVVVVDPTPDPGPVVVNPPAPSSDPPPSTKPPEEPPASHGHHIGGKGHLDVGI